MKREDIRKHIAGITDEQLDWLMNENGKDINGMKADKEKAETQVATLTGQLSDVQTKLSGFENVDVKDLQSQIQNLTQQLSDQKNSADFDYALDLAITSNKGRNVKAIRSMLNLDELKKSTDRSKAIDEAIKKCAEENAWAFDSADPGTVTVDLGGEHNGSSQETMDGVEKAFYELNPSLKKG